MKGAYYEKMVSIVLALTMIIHMSATAFAVKDDNSGLSLRCFDISTQTETIINVPAAAARSMTPLVSRGSYTAGTRKIIGNSDDRQRITNTTAFPYYAIVYLEIETSVGTDVPATGFMISEDVVLTAGHAVRYNNSNTTVTNITVYPGRNGASIPLSTTVDLIYTDTKYSGSNSGYTWDYAILTLDEPIGETTGWFSLFATFDESDLDGLVIQTAGYPEDSIGNDPAHSMYWSTGTISNTSDYLFNHNADTETGQSGSPIFFYSSSLGYAVAGIHVMGSTSYNRGRRITETLFYWLMDEGYISL